MDREFMTAMVEGSCPFAKRSGMKVREIAEDGRVVLALEASESNLNAFGLVHAGAICGLAETAGGMAIFRYIDPKEYVVLNTVLNIRFVSMPTGELTCTARAGADEIGFLMEELLVSGKADKTVDLKVLDADGKMVAQAQASFRLMPTPEQFKKYMG